MNASCLKNDTLIAYKTQLAMFS